MAAVPGPGAGAEAGPAAPAVPPPGYGPLGTRVASYGLGLPTNLLNEYVDNAGNDIVNHIATLSGADKAQLTNEVKQLINYLRDRYRDGGAPIVPEDFKKDVLILSKASVIAMALRAPVAGLADGELRDIINSAAALAASLTS